MSAAFERVDLVSITGFADTDAVFSFDADWGNAGYWAPYVYDYFTENDRERRTASQELRVLSKPGAIAGGHSATSPARRSPVTASATRSAVSRSAAT